MSDAPEKPQRRITATLEIGADSWRELATAFRNIATEIDLGNHQCDVVSGGHAVGYIFRASEDETMTHDIYVEANQRYVDYLNEKEEKTNE